ncbi:MAG: patatin family protein [Oscillospiraceae bacterium]|nr:patatin family protein [Oscillospiraceae bacterium]
MKTGLVLEGGAIRTIFSSGACDALLTRPEMPDYVVGVSAGIAYGVSYVSRQPRRNLDILLKYVHDKRYMGGPNLLRRHNRSYFGLQFTYETIPDYLIPFDYETYAAFPGEVEAVVTDLDSGEAAYLPVSAHDEERVLQATCALPFLFPVYHINGRPYMDGGAADPIPYQRAFDKGCERVVVILTRERSYQRQPEKLQPLIDRWYRRYPQFCAVMRRRAEQYNADRARLFQLEQEGKVLVLAPANTQGFSRIERDLDKIQALWEDGYRQALARIEEIEAFWRGA